MNVRVLQIEIQADIGDDLLNPVVQRALREYWASPDMDRHQHNEFTTSDGVKITTNNYYRYDIA